MEESLEEETIEAGEEELAHADVMEQEADEPEEWEQQAMDEDAFEEDEDEEEVHVGEDVYESDHLPAEINRCLFKVGRQSKDKLCAHVDRVVDSFLEYVKFLDFTRLKRDLLAFAVYVLYADRSPHPLGDAQAYGQECSGHLNESLRREVCERTAEIHKARLKSVFPSLPPVLKKFVTELEKGFNVILFMYDLVNDGHPLALPTLDRKCNFSGRVIGARFHAIKLFKEPTCRRMHTAKETAAVPDDEPGDNDDVESVAFYIHRSDEDNTIETRTSYFYADLCWAIHSHFFALEYALILRGARLQNAKTGNEGLLDDDHFWKRLLSWYIRNEIVLAQVSA